MARVTIISPAFKSFDFGYSLTSVVCAQAEVLQSQGHYVEVWVADGCSPAPAGVYNINACLPSAELFDYQFLSEFENPSYGSNGTIISPDTGKPVADPKHQDLARKVDFVLRNNLRDSRFVFTHDILLTGWNLPYYIGMRNALAAWSGPGSFWFHWLHSFPFHQYDWWKLADLRGAHKIVYPNSHERSEVAQAYQTAQSNVIAIPHFQDVRKINSFLVQSWHMTLNNPQILSADVVKVYPLSLERAEAKRLREVILIMAAIKRLGKSVCLIVCDRPPKRGFNDCQDADYFLNLAKSNRLTAKEVLFTSKLDPLWADGTPHPIVMDLFKLSNLFVFPTQAESFGLSITEAVLSGGVLPVINSDVPALRLILGEDCLQFSFGSTYNPVVMNNEAAAFDTLAKTIISALDNCPPFRARKRLIKSLNYESVYHRYYEPLLKGEF